MVGVVISVVVITGDIGGTMAVGVVVVVGITGLGVGTARQISKEGVVTAIRCVQSSLLAVTVTVPGEGVATRRAACCCCCNRNDLRQVGSVLGGEHVSHGSVRAGETAGSMVRERGIPVPIVGGCVLAFPCWTNRSANRRVNQKTATGRAMYVV